MNAPTDEMKNAPLGPGGYLLELPVTFEQGVGVTRAVSRESVRFSTRTRLEEGQRLAGHIRFPAHGDLVGSLLRYQARVTRVQELGGGIGGPFEVTALLERLAFVASAGG